MRCDVKRIPEASTLRHLAKEAACPALVDGEQLASLSSDLPEAVWGCWRGQGQQPEVLHGAGW